MISPSSQQSLLQQSISEKCPRSRLHTQSDNSVSSEDTHTHTHAHTHARILTPCTRSQIFRSAQRTRILTRMLMHTGKLNRQHLLFPSLPSPSSSRTNNQKSTSTHTYTSMHPHAHKQARTPVEIVMITKYKASWKYSLSFPHLSNISSASTSSVSQTMNIPANTKTSAISASASVRTCRCSSDLAVAAICTLNLSRRVMRSTLAIRRKPRRADMSMAPCSVPSPDDCASATCQNTIIIIIIRAVTCNKS